VQVSGISDATQVIALSHAACALKSDGTVACWGGNSNGELGDGTTTSRSTASVVPGLTGVTQVAGNFQHVCARLNNSTARCWGWNVTNQLGDGTTTNRLSPTAITDLTGIAEITAGVFGSCARLNDNTVRCWGSGNNGGLGDGNQTYQTSTKTSPTGLSNVSLISRGPGWGNECALLNSGTLKCWGLNDNGQIGDNSTTMRLSPVTVSGFAAAIVGIDVGFYTSCAVLANGTAMCWGWNGYGQIGDGSATNKYVPTLVSGLTTVSQISAGYTHVCAVLSDTSVKCWGGNTYGALGNGTTSNSSTAVSVLEPPVPLSSPTSVAASATSATAKSIDVSWNAVTNATSYSVKLYDAAGTSVLATKNSVSGTSTTLTTTDYGSIGNNTNYKVAVIAVGDGTNFLNSTESSQVSVTTNAVAVTPVISSQPAAASRTYGQSVTFSVSVSVNDGGTLSYQWLKGGVSISGANSSSYTINPLALTDAGSFSVIVTNTLSGALSTALTSSTATLTMSKASQSSLSITSTSSTYGSALTLTTSGGSGTGAVTFAVTSAGSAGCSISSGNVLNANTPGTCTVTATKATSTNYLAETSSATTITFARQSQSALSVSTTNGDLYTGIILSVLGGSGSGSVASSVSSGSANCTLTSGVVSARAVGTCVLTVTKAADTYYLSESATFTLTFSKAVPTQGSLTSPTSGTAGSGINLSFGGGSGTGAVSYTVSSPGAAGCTISNGVLNASNAGKCIVTIVRAADDTYASQSTNVEFTFEGNPMSSAFSTTTTIARATGSSVSTTTSTTSTTTTTSVPKKQLVAPKLVNTESAAGAATIGGKTAKAKTSRVNNQLVFTASGFTVTLAGVNADGTIIPLSAEGILEVRRGDMFRLDAQGFAPGSSVDIWMFSKTIYLGKIEVGIGGLVKSTFKVPKSVDDGLHHLVMVGVDKAKKEAKFEVGMNVGVPPKQWWYSRILIAIPISIAVFIGFWLPTSASRRRRQKLI
jgi:alpha-tubulin suppressor-like RCC1 family protein/precorrin-6B methylase 1